MIKFYYHGIVVLISEKLKLYMNNLFYNSFTKLKAKLLLLTFLNINNMNSINTYKYLSEN